jgi:hypothetical protein
VYLDSLDQFVKRRLKCRAYVRYVDDFLLFSEHKAQIHRWKEEIKAFLGCLRLTLHDRKSVVFPVTAGIDFLGYRIFPTFRRMRRTTVRRFTRRLRRLREEHRLGRINIQEVSQSIQSWVAHCRYAQSYQLRRAILSQIPF